MSLESAQKAFTDPEKHFHLGRKLKVEYATEEATLRGNPREYRAHLRKEEEKQEKEKKKTQAANEGNDTASAETLAKEEKRKFNAEQREQREKRQRRQPGEAPPKKLQAHQRSTAALLSAQRAPQGIVQFQGSKTTF